MPRKHPPRVAERLASFPLLNPNPIVEVDSAGKVTFCNDAAAKAAAQLGAKDASAFLPTNLADMLAALKRGERTSTQCEVRVGAATFAVTTLTVPNSNAVYIYAADVTERKRTEQALRESEERYRNLFSNSPLGIYRTTPDGRVLMANPALLAMLKFESIAALASRNLEKEGFDTAYPRERFKRMLESQGEVRGLEAVWHREDGERVVVRENARVVRGPDGRILYYEGTVEDITERKQAEEEAARRAREHALLYENAMAFVRMGPTDSVYQFICDKLRELAGEAYVVVNSYEPKTGRFTVRAISGLSRGMETVVRLLGREPVGTEFQLTLEQVQHYRKDGLQKFEHGLAGLSYGRLPKAICRALETTFGLEDIYAVAFYWGGEVLGTANILMRKGHALREPTVVGTFVGQSAVALARMQAAQELARHRLHLEELIEERTAELKQTQERLLLQEKLATVGRVAGSVAHELRNPLGAIRNASFFLQQTVSDKLEGKPLRHLQTIDEYVEHANRAITMILDFTWQQRTEPRRCDLRSILDRVLAESALPANVSVRFALPEHLPYLLVDDRRMVVVFRNLLTNAAQAMPAGGAVRITAEVTGTTISISVADTGSGIPSEHMRQLFEPFFTTKTIGVGLGLPICKEFVEANKGTISVASEVGKGTTFTITLPLAEDE